MAYEGISRVKMRFSECPPISQLCGSHGRGPVCLLRLLARASVLQQGESAASPSYRWFDKVDQQDCLKEMQRRRGLRFKRNPRQALHRGGLAMCSTPSSTNTHTPPNASIWVPERAHRSFLGRERLRSLTVSLLYTGWMILDVVLLP